MYLSKAIIRRNIDQTGLRHISAVKRNAVHQTKTSFLTHNHSYRLCLEAWDDENADKE